MNGPAIVHGNGRTSWWINDVVVYNTPLELSIGQSIPWKNDDVTLVIKQVNAILFQVLLGNQKLYLFSLADSQYKDTAYYDMTIPFNPHTLSCPT